MIAPARRAAFEVLTAVQRGTRDAASALARARSHLQDTRDSALAGELVSGVLRLQAALDAALAPLVSRPLASLDLEVLVALRLGAYQRLFLTRIPASAAVNDSVSLVRAAGRSQAAGVVNAVLRRLDPEAAHRAWPARPDPATHGREEALDYLSITRSHPRWIAERWLDRYGFANAETWTTFNNRPAPVTLRPIAWRVSARELALRLAHEGVHAEPTRYAADGLIVTTNVAHSHAAREGLFLIQDEASQLVAQLVIDLAPSAVLDACAAPGGKTIALRGGLPAAARLVAGDLRPRRLRVLQAMLARAGTTGVWLVQADFARGAPFRPAFDLVFVDAPCSGLGALRRDPEIRWRRVEADLRRLAAIQLQMLNQAAACVEGGGRIVYATCSGEPEENEQVVAEFLAHDKRFTALPRASHPWAGTRLDELLDENGYLVTTPHRHGLEAFFAAVLQYRGD